MGCPKCRECREMSHFLGCDICGISRRATPHFARKKGQFPTSETRGRFGLLPGKALADAIPRCTGQAFRSRQGLRFSAAAHRIFEEPDARQVLSARPAEHQMHTQADPLGAGQLSAFLLGDETRRVTAGAVEGFEGGKHAHLAPLSNQFSFRQRRKPRRARWSMVQTLVGVMFSS